MDEVRCTYGRGKVYLWMRRYGVLMDHARCTVDKIAISY